MARTMKLLSATNRFYLMSISIFFIFAGVMLNYSIRFNLKEELDEQLCAEQVHISKAMRLMDSLSSPLLPLNDNFFVQKAKPGIIMMPVLFDSLMYDNVEKEDIPYRLIRFSAQTIRYNYIVTIKKSEIESNDLALTIFISLMLVFGLFCIMLFVSNYFFSRKLWSPFLETITVIKNLKINDRSTNVEFPTTHIQEFNELNRSLQQMLERIKSDFLRMKDFSENASHELQTPLTIIHSKLESLLQSKELNKEDAKLISQALESAVRLSRLNKTLLLLTKIENRQFEQKQTINFSEVFTKYLELYSDMISGNKLRVELNKEEEFYWNLHSVLADILISNLLGNAIKHNIQNGNLLINVKREGFQISNTGLEPEFPTELLFYRFKKSNHSSDHLGLGLALVKEIVDTNGLEISYTFQNGIHTVRLYISD